MPVAKYFGARISRFTIRNANSRGLAFFFDASCEFRATIQGFSILEQHSLSQIVSAHSYLFNSIAHSFKQVPFTIDSGEQILNNGSPMLRPDDVDPRMIASQGEDAGSIVGMQNFRIGGGWDHQHVGPDGVFVGAFKDFANVSIGIYAAAAGLPENVTLTMADQYAGL